MARFFRLLKLILVFTLFWAIGVACAEGNEVVGTYRVEQVTDLGSEVRLTLHIRLVNNSPQDLVLTQVSLRDLRAREKPVAVAAWARLRPREGTTVEHDFVISRAEYQSWSKGVRPTLLVGLQPGGSREVVRIVQLIPLRARRQP